MTSLWRCDVCHELIDPLEDDRRTVLCLTLDVDGVPEGETQTLDLCEDCRPSSLSSHADWMLHQLEAGP